MRAASAHISANNMYQQKLLLKSQQVWTWSSWQLCCLGWGWSEPTPKKTSRQQCLNSNDTQTILNNMVLWRRLATCSFVPAGAGDSIRNRVPRDLGVPLDSLPSLTLSLASVWSLSLRMVGSGWLLVQHPLRVRLIPGCGSGSLWSFACPPSGSCISQWSLNAMLGPLLVRMLRMCSWLTYSHWPWELAKEHLRGCWEALHLLFIGSL